MHKATQLGATRAASSTPHRGSECNNNLMPLERLLGARESSSRRSPLIGSNIQPFLARRTCTPLLFLEPRAITQHSINTYQSLLIITGNANILVSLFMHGVRLLLMSCCKYCTRAFSECRNRYGSA